MFLLTPGAFLEGLQGIFLFRSSVFMRVAYTLCVVIFLFLVFLKLTYFLNQNQTVEK